MALRLVTLLGGPLTRTVIVVGGAVGLLVKGRYHGAGFVAMVIGGTGLLNTLIKKLVGRNRPGSVFGLLQRSSSFPSGHSSGTVALVGSFCALVWRASRNLNLVVACATLGAVWSGLVGYSRVKLHRHHVGDVLGGYVLGLLWLGVCVATARAIDRRK